MLSLGMLSLGMLSLGMLSLSMLSLGMLSLGMFSLRNCTISGKNTESFFSVLFKLIQSMYNQSHHQDLPVT